MTDPIDRAEAGFLAALAADPDDDTARLVYADWLDDRGDPRAALLRGVVAARQGGGPGGWTLDMLRLHFPPAWIARAAGPLPSRQEVFDLDYNWIGRDRPGCIVLLVGRASWQRSVRVGGTPVAEVIAQRVNRYLGEIIDASYCGEPVPRYPIDVALVGYGTGTGGAPVVGPLFGGRSAGRDLVPAAELAEDTLSLDRLSKTYQEGDGNGGFRAVVREVVRPVWYRPTTRLWSDAPMCAGLDYVRRLTAAWVLRHPLSFPPLVFHFTDGVSSDGDPTTAFDNLGAVTTPNGPLLLFNVLLGDHYGEAVEFPADPPPFPGGAGERLHAGATRLPDRYRYALDCVGRATQPGSRGLTVNCDPEVVLRLLPIGTSGGLFHRMERPTLPPHLL